jgi:serine/threonine protein kinase
MTKIGFVGKDSYWTVILVEDKSTHEPIVLKSFLAGSEDASDLFFREIEFLIRLNHPCVVHLVGYFLAVRRPGAQIGTEFVANKLLRDALDKSAALIDDTRKAVIFAGVIGMKFIHSQDVIHRDLKPANILLDDRHYLKSATEE